MTRVAVLGATGGVGRYVCAAFARAGADVLAVARNYAPHASEYKFIAGDLGAMRPREIVSLLSAAQVQVVVNATGGWASTPAEMEYAHVHLVRNLACAVAQLPQRPRLIQLGSIHEYGPVPPGTAIHEEIAPKPSTGYAETKLAGSQALLDAAQAGALDAVVLRAVNVCGPHSTSASFLGAVLGKLRQATPQQPIELSIADARRDYIDVRDLATATVRTAHAPLTHRVFNIGRGAAVPMIDLVSLLIEASGRPTGAVNIPDPGSRPVASKGGGWTLADISRARAELGWGPQIGLRDSLRDMWLAAP